MRGLVAEFRDLGGDALEVVSPSHTPAQYTEFAALARAFGLKVSCGTDFHGPGESRLDFGDLPPLPRGRRSGLERRGSRRVPACPSRTVFFISDRTGITAEMLGNSLLTQFEDIHFRRVTIPFVDSAEKAADAVRQVNETAAARGTPADRRQLGRRRSDERDDPSRRAGADARHVPDLHRAARSRARRKELACRRTLARHRQQPRVFRAHGGDQFHAGIRRRRGDARPRQGAGDPRRRLALRQDADLALPGAAVRHSRGEFSADAG